jgi:hypothetical protein
MSKRNSQTGRRGGQNSQGGEQRIIPSFIQKDVTLHKSDNAYTPAFKAKTSDGSEDQDMDVAVSTKTLHSKQLHISIF